MATDVTAPAVVGTRLAVYNRFLPAYPETAQRTYYLALTVLVTVALYYQQYCGGTVGPQLLNYYGITIKFYLLAAVIGLVFGAATAVLGGLADRIGRVNMVAYGLLVVGVLVAFVQPHMPNKYAFVAVGTLIGAVEGVILVATPALTRDFSPRLGRATAMSFWALGPVLGSLAASEVSSHTLNHLKAWQDQFTIAGITGLVIGVIAVFTLRELDPRMRDQIMVSASDRDVIEQRAETIDVDAAMSHPWRQMITGRMVTTAFGIAVFLMFYYVLVAGLILFVETTYLFSGAKANSIANWVWVVHAASLVTFGLVSDRLRVRKPIMVLGTVGSIVAVFLFLIQATRPHTTAQHLTVILAIQAVFGGMVFGPWLAGFTEMIEDRNPALIATGLAVSGGVLRVVVAATVTAFAFVVPAVTQLVDYGPQVSKYSVEYAAQVKTVTEIQPATLAALTKNPADSTALAAAVGQIETAENVSAPVAISRLAAIPSASKGLAYLAKHAPGVQKAFKDGPRQWQHWFLVTAIGQMIFLPLILVMIGPWTPAAGRRRDEELEARLHQDE